MMNSIKRALALVLALVICIAAAACMSACNGEQSTEDEGTDIYYIEYKGTKIKLGEAAEGVLKALGDAKSVKELGDCGGLGAQVKYTYDDFDLYTLKSGDKETIDQISFRSDLVSTSKGICIGDGEAKVNEAYGDDFTVSKGVRSYVDGNLVLKISIANGAVDAIEFIRVTG